MRGAGPMRRIVIAVTLLALAPITGARAVVDPVPLIARPCTLEGPLDVARPASCRRVTYLYGPLHVTSGDNLILFGPVTIERPLGSGHVVRFKPDLIRADGSVPPIEEVHLHHAVWISTAFADPLFATGEEKTIISLPNGYGLPIKQQDTWLLNYMLHNQLPTPDTVFITYDIDFIPSTAPESATTEPVEPRWLDVGGFNGFNPVYNTQQGYGAVDGECSFPKEECAAFDPYGRKVTGNGLPGNGRGLARTLPAGTVVFMLGHVHPGGLRLELNVERAGSGSRPVFRSDAVYFDPNGPVSWDMAMEVTRPDYRLRVRNGDTFVLNSVYDTEHSWYEGMGIVVTYVARNDTSGADPFSDGVDPNNVDVTHGHLEEASHYGGPDRPAGPAPMPVETDTVLIGGYSYAPGAANTIPAVERGDELTFINTDAAAQIFHTVTSCPGTCNGQTGISYPLAGGSVDFDSLQLGYGPPGVTAAANRADWVLDTGDLQEGSYNFFCRVHPFMRGAFKIT